MKAYELPDRIEYLDHLIRIRNTGSPKELSQKLRISESRLYDILKEMRVRGAPIRFSKLCNSYEYASDGKFYCKFCWIEEYSG